MNIEFIHSWGRVGTWPHDVKVLESPNDQLTTFSEGISGLPYGNGRSYGDVCLNPGAGLWKIKSLDNFINFDDKTGLLCCEAGVLLGDIQSLMVPRGWILPVSPGTQFVTVGGAIANDVHGKNHHSKGSFGNHIRKIELLRTDGSRVECGPDLEPELFFATIGGLGLTGIIIRTYIQLMPVNSPWIESEAIPFKGISEFLDLSDSSENDWEYTVSWIDCLSGKDVEGIFFRANHSSSEKNIDSINRHFAIPFTPPLSLVNEFTLKPFNFIYKNLQKLKRRHHNVHYQSFFYPLDNIIDWNRMYGPKGFYQYQSVIPRTASVDATENMLNEIAHSGTGSFLAVLKTFGMSKSLGMLSFARPGLTLALDFPNEGEKTFNLFNRLDAIVKEAGGRLYPAKDMLMSKDMFESGYPEFKEFQNYRDPGISSAFSRRVMGY